MICTTRYEELSYTTGHHSQSFYLLGQKEGSSFFKRYRTLMEMSQEEGVFLSFETNSDWLACYSADAQPLHDKLPLLVFRPHGISNISSFLKACHQLEISVTVRCGGTGLSGGCIPSTEGVILLTGHLNCIKDYDREEGVVALEPGVTPHQLNRHIAEEGWHFPLSLATGGTAGIGGCLSCHSRGYHQQQHSIYDAIQNVTLVDGKGNVINLPGAFVCGAEGLWGVVIEIRLRLTKLPQKTVYFSFQAPLKKLLLKLPSIQPIQTLANLIWVKEFLYLKLEGEAWRLPSSIAYLEKCLPGIVPADISLESVSKKFYPSYRHFFVVSVHFRLDQLCMAMQYSLELAEELQLECLQMIDLLAGTLHLILQSGDPLQIFSQKSKQFLVLLTDYVDRRRGMLSGTHGVGVQLRHYMPPFWTEETQGIWRNLQKYFDPKNLFGRDRFFPILGKSLEKVRLYE